MRGNNSEGIKAAKPEFPLPSIYLFSNDMNDYEAILNEKIKEAEEWKLQKIPIMGE